MSNSILMKSRVPVALWESVKMCAEAVDCPLEDWTYAVCRDYAKGKFGVPKWSTVEVGTRGDSVTPWIRIPVGFDPSAANLRAALRAGVEHVRPKLRPALSVAFHGFVIAGRGNNVTVRKEA